ncbi:FtsB family cell division protein [Pleionea mediterranea]|jgi:cell division protein FtsB|uniref:Cell division protein FtsB n=1 Tax=Pleionea mediterranea TaxID=523701 RepID=A0A316F9L9_9GAMM|nr:septum formation initiator family protein [Pleionea mediterranea]PWK44412.1 cell division protein FtsB [Pleionea mediterranea]
MKWSATLLILLLAGLQVRLWSPDGGLAELEQLKQQVSEQKHANEQLRQRNAELHKQVKALRNNEAAIEQYARLHLGMIKPGETFYRFVSSKKQ